MTKIPDPIEPLLAHGKVAAAVPLLEGALAAMPAGWTPRTDTPERLEVSFWDQGEFIAYVAHAKPTKNVIWRVPNYARYCYYLAFAAVERQDLRAAKAWVERGLGLEEHPLLLSEKALILGYEKKRAEAIAMYRRATTVMPWYPLWMARAHRGIGFELIEERDLDGAEREFKRALELEPNHPVALNELRVIADLRKGGVKSTPSLLTRGGGATEAQQN